MASNSINAVFLASEWKSSKGGLSTLNRELAINVAECSDVKVTFFVPHCNDEEKKAACDHKIDLVEAKEITGLEEIYWLSFLPEHLTIDVVIGHGRKLGPQAVAIKRSRKCKWIQVVHTAPEEIAMHKTYCNPISRGEKKNEIEVELCKQADFVVTVGPKLYDIFRRQLCSCKSNEAILHFTPGIFREFSEVKQDRDREGKFKVLLFGRGDTEDFELKGFDIAAKAVASSKGAHLIFVGAPEGKKEELKRRFLDYSIPNERLTVRGFVRNRESLKKVLCEADLAVMPSRTEGFGLTGLEALSAGLPILVSRNSGFGEAVFNLPFGKQYVIHSDHPGEWSRAISEVMKEDREKRLTEVDKFRSIYEETYSWKEQCEELISKVKMIPDKEKDPNEGRENQQGDTKPKEEVSMMRGHFRDQRGHRQETREENSTSQEQITELQEKLRTFGEEMETMKQQLADLHGKVRRKDEEKEILQKQFPEMEGKVSINEQEMEKMRLHLHGQIQQKDKDKERLQQKVTELQKRLIINEKEMRLMREQLADLHGQLEDKERLKQQVAELQEKLSVKEEEMRKVREQLRGQSETLEKELKEEQQQTTSRDWVINWNEVQITDELEPGRSFRGRFCDFDVAVKKMYGDISSPHDRKWFERIANIASDCHHPCLLQVFGVTADEGTPLIVTEIMDCSLREKLYDKGKSLLSTQEVSIISLDVARALNYLHRKPRPIIHLNISSASVLLRLHDNQWRAKVADYGIANFCVRQCTRKDIKTAMYIAPESLNEAPDQSISCKVDVYSFGVLLCEMCIQEEPNREQREGQIDQMVNLDFQRLVRNCVERDPMLRPNMEEVIKDLKRMRRRNRLK